MNARTGIVAIIAALLVAFGAFALNSAKPTDAANAINPVISLTQGGLPVTTVPSGTTIFIRTLYTNAIDVFCVNVGAASSVGPGGPIPCPGTAPTGGATTGTLQLVQAWAAALPSGQQDVTVQLSGDQCTAAAVYCTSTAQMGTILPILPGSLAIDTKVVLTCATTAGGITVTSTQDDSVVPNNPVGPNTKSATVDCTVPPPVPPPVSSEITVKKVDQFGNLVSAIFSLQANVGGIWVDISRLSTAGSNNPCSIANSSCANPVQTALAAGTYRVIEVTTPGDTQCTLVQVTDGNNSIAAPGAPGGGTPGFGIIVGPVSVTVPATGTTAINTLKLTFVNSCTVAGNPNATGSQVVVVIGGSSFAITNTSNIEIVPAPGSDDDARIDIRIRDEFLIPVAGTHVVISTDKGTLALRADVSTATTTGIDVVEPSSVNFGTRNGGDTCDYILTQSLSSGAISQVGIRASRQAVDGFTNSDGIISACLFVDGYLAPGTTPGTANITVLAERPGTPFAGLGCPGIAGTITGCAGLLNLSPQILSLTARVTVVGPPASITVTASPTSLNCGEKATLTVTVRDSANQLVSDHSRVEVITNAGGVLAGTGSTIGFPGVGITNPISSTAAETFNGVATFFLLTSTQHVGPYEVVVTTGGSVGGFLANADFGTTSSGQIIVSPGGIFNTPQGVFNSVGAFSTPPVSSQVTVTCSLPAAAPAAAPAVTAPRTGEGPVIRPPNTGDAGLVAILGNE